MSYRKLGSIVLSVAVLALVGADEPVKIEFKGWFSNPVFSADGKVLAYARLETLPIGARTAPTQIILWDVKAGRETRKIDGPSDDSLVGPVALSPNGKRLAIGMWNTALRLWDLEAGKEISRVAQSQGAQHPRFSHDGRTIAWLRNNEVHLADAATGMEVSHFAEEMNNRITALAFADNGKVLLTSQYRATEVNEPGAGKNRPLKYEITCWSRDLASGKKGNQIGATSTETRRRFQGLPANDFFVSGDGKVLLVGESIQVCNPTTGKKDRDIPVPWKSAADDPIRRIAMSTNGQVAAVVSARGVIAVWDLVAGKELRRIETAQSIEHVALSPDGKTLAVTHQTPGRVGAVLLIFSL